jgi:aspartyl-tRNA(Asn)/glutamyl-tRNA(Gln) amidotransferase subunit A
LLEQFFMEHADAAVRKVTESALEKLRQAGAEIVPVTLPGGFDDVRAIHRTVMAVEAAAYHREQFAAHRAAYGPMIASLLDEGLAISGVDYAAALARQREFRRRVASLFDGVDALIMPSTDTTAPPSLETTGTPKFQAPWSCAGVPVVSIPSGLADDGMPAALQIVGPAGSDAAVLQVARWCEQRIGFEALPPLWKVE